MKIPLSKPFKYRVNMEDVEITEIDLDLANAPGNVLRRADMEIQRRKHVPSIKQMDTMYCGLVASYITKIPYDELESLPLADFGLITNAVMGFLLNGSEATEISALASDE